MQNYSSTKIGYILRLSVLLLGTIAVSPSAFADEKNAVNELLAAIAAKLPDDAELASSCQEDRECLAALAAWSQFDFMAEIATGGTADWLGAEGYKESRGFVPFYLNNGSIAARADDHGELFWNKIDDGTINITVGEAELALGSDQMGTINGDRCKKNPRCLETTQEIMRILSEYQDATGGWVESSEELRLNGFVLQAPGWRGNRCKNRRRCAEINVPWFFGDEIQDDSVVQQLMNSR